MAAVKAHAGPQRYAILFPLNEFEPLLALSLQGDGPLISGGGRRGAFESQAFREALRSTWTRFVATGRRR